MKKCDNCKNYVKLNSKPCMDCCDFDKWEGEMTTDELTGERGKNYGHPYDHFRCTYDMYSRWAKKRDNSEQVDPELEKCLHHIVYFICDKLARLAENPMHMDNFDDIQGYASLWKKCVEKAQEIENESA